jgi:hypothetical protein
MMKMMISFTFVLAVLLLLLSARFLLGLLQFSQPGHLIRELSELLVFASKHA